MQPETNQTETVKNLIPIVEWAQAPAEIKQRVMGRSQQEMGAARSAAQQWIERIRTDGDRALVEYIRTYDDPHFSVERLRVVPNDIAEAYSAVDPHVVAMIRRQIEISREFHERQRVLPPDGRLLQSKVQDLLSLQGRCRCRRSCKFSLLRQRRLV